MKTYCTFLLLPSLHHSDTAQHSTIKPTNLNSEDSTADKSSFLLLSCSFSCMWFMTASTSSSTRGWWCCASQSTLTKMEGSRYMAVVVSRRRIGLHTLNTWWVGGGPCLKEDLLMLNYYIFSANPTFTHSFSLLLNTFIFQLPISSSLLSFYVVYVGFFSMPFM